MNTYRWILRYASKYWTTGLIAALAMAIDAGSAASFAHLVKPMIDGVFSQSEAFPAWHLAMMIVSILGIRSLAGYIGDTRMSYIGRMTVRNIRLDAFSAQIASIESDAPESSVGDRVASIAFAAEQVAFSVTDAIKVILLDGLTSLFCVGLMFYLSPLLAATMVIVIPMMALVTVATARRVRRLSLDYQRHVSEANNAVVEAWMCARYIKVFGAFGAVSAHFQRCSSTIASVGLSLSRVVAAASASTQLAGAIALSSVVIVASGAINPGGSQVSAGTFFAIVTAMGIAVPSLRRLSGVYSSLQKALVAADSLRSSSALVQASGDLACRSLRSSVDIEFADVGLRYPRGSEALFGVSFRCKAGTLTMIVGESGSGKSSLLAMLPRFRLPTSGKIFIDGIDLSSMSIDSIYGGIAWVGSSSGLLSGTVRENIAFGELSSATETEVISSAIHACAWSFISRLPQGLDTVLGPGGYELSDGQRQRILLARAMLKKSAIVLLDEATSALDRRTERDVGEGMMAAFRGRTVLMATHRLDLAEFAEQIIVMDKGRVAEVGTHLQLLARRTAYWRLVSSACQAQDAANT